MSILEKGKDVSTSWEKFLRFGERKYFKKNTNIIKQGDFGTGFYYIDSGIVKVSALITDNRERILDISGPGVIIGDPATDHLPGFYSAISHENSILYHFTKKDFERISKQHPEVTLLIAKVLIDRQRYLLNIINAKNVHTEYQIARVLLYLMDSYKRTEINLTQQELSQFVGLTRITVYKTLKKWIDDGLVTVKNRKMFILNPNALEEILLA